MQLKKNILKAINDINKKLNTSTKYITLDDYFNFIFTYLDYLNQELIKIAFKMKTNFQFNPTSLKIKSVQRSNENESIWLINLTLQLVDLKERDLYITVINNHLEYNTSYLQDRKNRINDFSYKIDKKSLKEFVNLIIKNYNFITLKSYFMLDNDNSYLLNRLHFYNQDILFHSNNLDILQHLDGNRELILKDDLKIHLINEETLPFIKQIKIDLNRLPVFIKDYQKLFPSSNHHLNFFKKSKL